MAVFVAASDESIGNNNIFRHSGFIAPESDWSNIFTPLWDTRVLKGPPRIPYLHMTDIRSRQWREDKGIDRTEGEFRVDEAFGVIRAIPSLTPISCRLSADRMSQVMQKKLYFQQTKAVRPFLPDFLAFVVYAFSVLEWVHRKCPDAEKVDFIIEKKKGVTQYIQEFFDTLKNAATLQHSDHLVPLIGQLIPGDKERVPLQAADLLCWYSKRATENNLDPRDIKRYFTIANRKGVNAEWPDNLIDELYASLLERLREEDERIAGISEVRSNDGESTEGSTQRDQEQTGCGESGKSSKEAKA